MRLSSLVALGLLLALLGGLWRLATPDGSGEPSYKEATKSFHYGEVRDDHGPLAGARVRLQATPRHTETDARGRFRLASEDTSRKLTAWKAGYLIGSVRPGQSPSTIRLEPLPARDHEAYQWVDPAPDPAHPQNCGNCHKEIYREWQVSGHGQSATDYHFRNLYTGTDYQGRPGAGWGLLTQYEAGAAVCASCHAPALADSDPASADLSQLADGALGGSVHCDYCHKIADAGRDRLGLSHGRYNLQLLRPGPGRQLFFGPLDDVDRGEDAYTPLYRDSRYCASCHEGVVFGIHVYSTYSEWLASPARQQGLHCQDCHTKPTGHMTNIAPGHGGLERDPATLGNHRFFAGSKADMLRRCLRLDWDWKHASKEVSVTLRISVEGVGHRVPTGSPDRHLVLVAEGFDALGNAMKPVREWPRPPGEMGHTYAKVLRTPDGQVPAPFWRADPEPVRDTRLTPGKSEEMTFSFKPELARVRVRLLYRRFWPEVIQSKGWPDRDLVVLEQEISAPPAATSQ